MENRLPDHEVIRRECLEILNTLPQQQQAGAAEVSDDELWASDEVMAINAELGLPMEKLVKLARAILALKTSGGVA